MRVAQGHLRPPGVPLITIGYLISGFIMLVCVFSPWWAIPEDWSSRECGWSAGWDGFYSITAKTVWGAAICFMIYAALTCQGGPITRFLTWSFWTPFARLTCKRSISSLLGLARPPMAVVSSSAGSQTAGTSSTRSG